MSALADATIEDLAGRIADRSLTAEAVVDAVLARVEALDRDLNAYAFVDAEAARTAARLADREISRDGPRSALHGLPISVKDNLAVDGWRITNGSPSWSATPSFDAAVVERLRAAGAIILGTNTMHEWAMGGTCARTVRGPVRNPWDPARIPGGSSGGGAVAVSAGLATAAIGTDGMGSIRSPAAFCGVVGFKPTFGRVSRYGDLPPSSSWVNHIGTITRTVGDARILLAVIEGHDERDPTSRRIPSPPAADPLLRPLRVGRLRSPLDEDTMPGVRRAVDEGADRLRDLGASVTDVEIESLGLASLCMAGTGSETQSVLLDVALAGPDAFLNPDIRYRVLAAEFVRAVDVRRARQLATRIRTDLGLAFELVDVLLTATTPIPAYPIDAERVDLGSGSVDVRRPFGQSRITTRSTFPFNLAGLPAISVPAADLVEGLPVGLQLVGRAWHDTALLDVAERIGPITPRTPEIAHGPRPSG